MQHQFIPDVTDEERRKERAKAQKLRKTQWWKRKCSEGHCYFCGKKFKPKELTMEHIVPLIRGGKTIKSNIVPSCKDCNTEKKYLLPIEWEAYLKRLDMDTWS